MSDMKMFAGVLVLILSLMAGVIGAEDLYYYHRGERVDMLIDSDFIKYADF